MKLLAEGLWIFVLFSFLGWTAHCVWQSVKEKRPLNVGFLVRPTVTTPLSTNILAHLAAHADAYNNRQIRKMGRDAVRNIVIQNLIQRRTYSLLASIRSKALGLPPLCT